MNDPQRPSPADTKPEEDPPSGGPNLWVAYTLIALGLLTAFALAALIVWPFYKAR
jgi:hypothetical protein